MPAKRNGTTNPSASSTTKLKQHQDDEDDEDNDERFPQAEGDAEGGYSYDGSGIGSSVPLVTKHRAEENELDGDIVFDGDEELQQQQQANSTLAVVPYAHRDLKPGYVIVPPSILFELTLSKLFDVGGRNIMIADDGKTPILMDFGSTMKARVPIENRSQALLQQVCGRSNPWTPF
jgi:serine/threonine kinase 16